MKQPPTRPEDRWRGGAACIEWADTLPSCFRSEAFAEDLQDAEAARQPVPAAGMLGGNASPPPSRPG